MNPIRDYIRPQIVSGIDVVPYMDAKNIWRVIDEYLDYTVSKPFLNLYLSMIGKLFDHCIKVDDSKTNVYITEYPDIETLYDHDYDEDFNIYMNTNTLSSMEHWLLCQFIQFLDLCSNNKTSSFFTTYTQKYPNEYSFFTSGSFLIHDVNSFLSTSIPKSTVFINYIGHNTDSRSTRANEYKYNPKKDSFKKHIVLENPIVALDSIYFPNGFSIFEYLISILRLRGCIYDRWYTLFCEVEDINIRSMQKPWMDRINKIKNDNKYTEDECVYLTIDHGS